ncbi:MAG TPA: hypothetical protein H9799_01445 [Candidatus Mediterraneibacter merdipullorum]|nr:hypothetical protein [Candidatus Mediterraneibacter merdipullorum]
MGKRCWKSCVRAMLYCRPGINRWLLCMRSSMQEVCRVLNSGFCHDCGENMRKDRWRK